MNHFRFFAPDFEKAVKAKSFEFDPKSVKNYRIVDADQQAQPQPPAKQQLNNVMRRRWSRLRRARTASSSPISSRARPLVLLVHGFPDTAHTWDRAMPAVADAGYRAVAPFHARLSPRRRSEEVRTTATRSARDRARADRGARRGAGDRRRARLGRERGVCSGGARAGARAAAGHARDPAPEIDQADAEHVVDDPPLLHAARARARPRRLRANDFAYIDELVRRWSPAWKDLPATRPRASKAAFAQPGCLEAACGTTRRDLAVAAAPPRERSRCRRSRSPASDDIIAPRAYEKARHCYEARTRSSRSPAGTSCTASIRQSSSPSCVRDVAQEHARRM